MAHGVVDQVGQRALDQLQVAFQFQPAGRRALQGDGCGRIAQLELLHRVGHQFVQAEALAVQHLVGRLQRRQLEQLLRQAAHLVALRQRGTQHALASRGIGLLRERAAGQRFQVTVQRGQRCAQVVGHAGHRLAVRAGLRLLARGVRFDAPRGLVEGRLDVVHLVGPAGRRSRALITAGAVVAHARGQPLQRPGEPAKREHAEQQRHQQADRGRQARALPDTPQAQLPGHLVARAPVEHHVQVARRTRVCGTRREHRGAENARHARAHRVAAAQRQGGAGQEGAHRLQVDLRLAHHAGLAEVGVDATVGVQHIDLHAGVHHHQHAQQRFARGAVGLVHVGQRDLRPVLDDVPRQAVRQPLQRLLLVLGRHLPAEQRDEGAVGQQQQRQGQRQAGAERARADHADPQASSKR